MWSYSDDRWLKIYSPKSCSLLKRFLARVMSHAEIRQILVLHSSSEVSEPATRIKSHIFVQLRERKSESPRLHFRGGKMYRACVPCSDRGSELVTAIILHVPSTGVNR